MQSGCLDGPAARIERLGTVSIGINSIKQRSICMKSMQEIRPDCRKPAQSRPSNQMIDRGVVRFGTTLDARRCALVIEQT